MENPHGRESARPRPCGSSSSRIRPVLVVQVCSECAAALRVCRYREAAHLLLMLRSRLLKVQTLRPFRQRRSARGERGNALFDLWRRLLLLKLQQLRGAVGSVLRSRRSWIVNARVRRDRSDKLRESIRERDKAEETRRRLVRVQAGLGERTTRTTVD